MKVKICGIKSTAVAKYAVKCGADAIGFVFSESKRQITATKARVMIQELPDEIWKVGVFVDEDPQTVNTIAAAAGLTHIQLHGEENVKDYAFIGLPIIKSASIVTQEDSKLVNSFQVPFILLDGPPGKFKGGNGKGFDWNIVAGVGESIGNIILAGGLNSQNVQEAIGIIKPFMVDVSSGVETNGEKDFLKIETFVKKAKSQGRQESYDNRNV